MDWNDSPEQAAFRAEARTYIQEKLPERYKQRAQTSADREDEEGNTAPGGIWQVDRVSSHPERRAAAKAWASALAERGWVAPQWPKEYGGASLSAMESFILNWELAEAGAPPIGGQGVTHVGPAIYLHGTEEQKREHLGAILTGDIAWSQGFSEPGAGSDLASLTTRAERDGDEYVLNGQKIWTSGAQFADKLFVLVRTDPDAPKHAGISFLLMEKDTPGVTVSPLTDMAWQEPFNETFFEDARVPVQNRVGEENRGWYVAMNLLDFERSRVALALQHRRMLGRLLTFLHSEEGQDKSRLEELPTLRLQVADRFIEAEVLINFAMRVVSAQASGVMASHETSANKLFGSELTQGIPRTATRVFGLYANLWDDHDPRAPMEARFTHDYIRSIPATIAAGTSEVQRNIIATRGLGLPRG
jgi:alkylation response protein AidB-like acyl-CoA dehydrogenase